MCSELPLNLTQMRFHCRKADFAKVFLLYLVNNCFLSETMWQFCTAYGNNTYAEKFKKSVL